MKHTLKKITAIAAAAVMCALPTAGNLSASAAGVTQYRVHRSYVISKRTNSGIKTFKATHTRESNLTKMDVRTGSFSGSYTFGGNNAKSTVDWTPLNNRCDEIGVVVSFTDKTTSGEAPTFLSGTGVSFTRYESGYVDAFDIESIIVGDVTSEMNGAGSSYNYDGLTGMDALKAQIFLNNYHNCTYYGEDAIKIETFLRSANYNSLGRNTIRGILASDINNDGYVTAADASAIMCVLAGRYTDLTAFCFKGELAMRNMVD